PKSVRPTKAAPSGARARSPVSPAPCRKWPRSASRKPRRRKMTPTMTTTPRHATSTNFVENLHGDFEELSSLGEPEFLDGLMDLLLSLSPPQYDDLKTDFPLVAHPHQLPPEHAGNGEDWTTWLILGGRGAGKTRAGAEW